jgi:hypothetical protein
MRNGSTLLMALVIATGGVSCMPLTGRFDSSTWKQNAGNYDGENPRAAMVARLERIVRVGTKQNDIERLLGQPDQKEGETTYIYYLGRDPIGPSYSVYEIVFDNENCVVQMNWRRH